MKVGITGHQKREGADWIWTREELRRILSKISKLSGYSSLAIGADQIFADCVLSLGGNLFAVVPMRRYSSLFDAQSLNIFQEFIMRSTRVDLNSEKRDEDAFLDAGKWIVDEVDLMIAVWDGERADGRGGTADIVEYCEKVSRRVCHVNPITHITSFI